MDGAVPLAITLRLDGAPIDSESLLRHASAYSLTISTTLPRPDLPLTLQSTYVSAPGAPTHVTHLHLGPGGIAPQIDSGALRDGGDAQNVVVFGPADCAFDHAHRLMDWVNRLGHQLQVDITEAALAVLEATPP